MLKSTLLNVLKLQKENLSHIPKGIKREMLNNIKLHKGFAAIISGIRRCGKSTLLKQIMEKHKNFNFVNFEDTRLYDFSVSDFSKLLEVFDELEWGDIYFFDEIQNVNGWERFVRALLDKKKTVIITGSNASLLSKELGTKLTGRHIKYELFPFSYSEFLRFLDKKDNTHSFNEYFEKGGFPEFLKLKDSMILSGLFEDVLVRDITIRHKIRNSKELEEISLYLISNIAKTYTYNSLKKIFDMGSVNTIISYLKYLQDSYLFFSINKFDYSVKKQIKNPKKIYCIDNGMINSVSLSRTGDLGRKFENLVFLELRKKYNNICYFKEEGECDFIVEKKAIQVCYKLTEENKKREIDGLLEAKEKLGLDEAFIITHNQKDNVEGIKVIPFVDYAKKSSL